jgi:hypothetical protein
MAGDIDLIWGRRETIYFFDGDWTGGISLKLKEIFFSTRIPVLERFPAKWMPVRAKKTRQATSINFLAAWVRNPDRVKP